MAIMLITIIHENDVNFMLIMITIVATVMIMRTRMIKIIMVMIIVINAQITLHLFMDGF